ncbi:MAG: HAD family phosphatase [Haliscomenobacter sp.]|nr:HAD family phosphatase [Haliscomenobacter sp.]MBK9490294.1 HAD family phosphatase [Haliscomenobacter sp.]
MAQFKTIIFDLGGVLVDWNPRYMYRQIFSDEAEMERFLAEVTTGHWNEQQDAGRTLAEATELLVAEHPHYESEIRAFYGRWTEMLNGAIEDTVVILDEIRNKGKHRVYALTNWSNETFPYALDNFHFMHWFEGILVSGDEKLIKPDPAIYELILSRYNIERSTALFIDDNLKNVHGALAVGLPAVQFESPEQLRAFLEEKGVL